MKQTTRTNQLLSFGLAATMSVYSVAHLGCANNVSEPEPEAEAAEAVSSELVAANWINEAGEQIAMSVADNHDGTGSVYIDTTNAFGEVVRDDYVVPLHSADTDRDYGLSIDDDGESFVEVDGNRFPIVGLQQDAEKTTGTMILPNDTLVDFSYSNGKVVYGNVALVALIAALGMVALAGLCSALIFQTMVLCVIAHGSNACWSWVGSGTGSDGGSGFCMGACNKCDDEVVTDPGNPGPGETEDPTGGL